MYSCKRYTLFPRPMLLTNIKDKAELTISAHLPQNACLKDNKDSAASTISHNQSLIFLWRISSFQHLWYSEDKVLRRETEGNKTKYILGSEEQKNHTPFSSALSLSLSLPLSLAVFFIFHLYFLRGICHIASTEQALAKSL